LDDDVHENEAVSAQLAAVSFPPLAKAMFVIPAKAGIQAWGRETLDPRFGGLLSAAVTFFRGNDEGLELLKAES
jgi:hypothetical protein